MVTGGDWRIPDGVQATADEQAFERAGVPGRVPGEQAQHALEPDARRNPAVKRVACFRPIPAYSAPGGGVVFDSKRGYVDRPLQLPCGICQGCRMRRSHDWALRCVHEASCHEANCFVTLTYDQAHVPEDGGLVVEDWQKFAKRLRKEIGPFRFFHCGEYGERSFRPHYHALLFGVDFRSDRVQVARRGDYPVFHSELLSRKWGLGLAEVGTFSFQSAAYVARYVLKKALGPDKSRYERVDHNTGECWSVRPEYITMSRNPGIGSKWFDRWHTDVYPSDEVVYEGRKFRPPRFYDSKLPEDQLEGLKAARRRRAFSRREDCTPERLRVRESVAVARLGQLDREI